MSDVRKKPALGVLAASAIGGVLGVGVIYLGADGFVEQKRLGESGVHVAATVTDAREMRGGSSQSFEIRYTFEVPGHAGTFTLCDNLGRKDLWATTDGQEDWERALRTRQVDVVYLPSDPRINRLVRRHGNPLGDPLGGAGLGLLVAGVSLWVGALEATGRGQRWRAFVDRMRESMTPKRS